MSDTAACAGSLATARLALRWLTVDDAGFMLSIWNDPAFVKFVGDRGLRTADEARQALEQGVLRQYEAAGYGPYLLCLADNGEPIGLCGLFRRQGLADPDIGFALLPPWRDKGLAREAAEAVLAEARGRLGLTRVTAIVSPQNEDSLALIRKLGLSYERMLRMPGDDHDVSLYGVDWSTSPAG